MSPDKALETIGLIVKQRNQARFERDVVKARAIQLRRALLWAKERLIPSGLCNAGL